MEEKAFGVSGSTQLTETQYKELWAKLSPIKIEMTEKAGSCPHNLGQIFIYNSPYDKPQGICSDLLHVLDFYFWRVTLGFPSWENDNRSVYRIHCPSKKGTVWEMTKLR